MGLRGLEERQEQKSAQLIRDTRTMGQRFNEFLKNRAGVGLLLVMLGLCGTYAAGFADIFLIAGIFFFIASSVHKVMLPFRLPSHAGILDYNDLIPGTTTPKQARGIYYFGNEKQTQHELWFSNEDVRTHVLIFGSTGSGKTESLVSLSYNALVQGSGFIYVDGKGDNALYAKVFSMVRYMGREDDLLLINFMTGARDIIGPQEKRISNTMNPFSSGSSSMLSQLIVSMMDSSSGSSDGDMWKGRAIAFVEALMKVLVAVRDAGYILLDANTIRNYFMLERIQGIVEDKRFVRDGLSPISLAFLPDEVLEPLKNYLINLPGYNKEKKNKQVSQVLEQHGFITMQLTRVFTSLADTYGHIIRTKLAEVDVKDVVLNRRVLVVLLPALEKSPDELSNLGKVIVASLKAMMAAGLGEEVEGDFHELIAKKPTNAPTPFLCILDEYGYYSVKGFAIVAAQARSLGFFVVFASQDLPSFQKASKEEALSIVANTNIKICMKLEDPQETWELIMKTAGESYVTHVSGFQSKSGSVSNAYMDTQGASVEKRQRVDVLDLKDQVEGDAHIFFRSRIVRARMFYANPDPVKKLRLNQFLKVDLPKDEDLYTLVKGIEDYARLVKQNDMIIYQDNDNESIAKLILLFSQQRKKESPIKRAVGVLLAYKEASQESNALHAEVELADERLNAFTRVQVSDKVKAFWSDVAWAHFESPLLQKGEVYRRLMFIQRLAGSSDTHASLMATNLMDDMELASAYPPDRSTLHTPGELLEVVQGLLEHVTIRKEEERKRRLSEEKEKKGRKGGKK